MIHRYIIWRNADDERPRHITDRANVA